MTITFAKAPLVEIIAEVRWPMESEIQVGPVGISLNDVSQERLYSQFSDLAAKSGYPRSERLLPPGFPVNFGQVSWRFRPIEGNTLWQIGPGVFTANALPPYKSWEEFRPHLKSGLKLLLESRAKVEPNPSAPNVISLRYVDAFGGELMQGHTMVDFLCDQFGFELKLPSALIDNKAKGAPLQLNTNFEFRLNDGMHLNMVIGPGVYQSEQVLMMTTGVIKNTPTENTLDSILEVFEQAHKVIHDAFLGMTKSIHERMQPIEVK